TTRVTALVQAVERCDRELKLFHFGNRRAQLTDFRPWVRSAVRTDDQTELAASLAEIVADETVPGRIMVVVEDITQTADGDADRAMRSLLQALNNSDHILVAETDVTRAGGVSGGLGGRKHGRQGVARKPDRVGGVG